MRINQHRRSLGFVRSHRFSVGDRFGQAGGDESRCNVEMTDDGE